MPEHLIHRQLDLLRGAVGEARMAARDLERKQARARTALEQAHATVVEALAEEQSQPKLKIARKQEDDARAALAELEAQAEAGELRIRRAEQRLAGFLAEHSRELAETLIPEARHVAAELSRSVGALTSAMARYVDVWTRVNGFVATTPGASPRVDGPRPIEAWQAAVRELERAFATSPPAPVPSWSGVEQRRVQDEEASAVKLQRKTPAKEA